MSNQYPPQYPTPDQPQQPIYPSGQMYPPPPPPPPPPYYQPPAVGYAPAPYPTAVGYAPGSIAPNISTSAFAIAALICGILGLCTGVTAIGAIICGHLALNQIKRSGGVIRGHGMAVAGLVLGYVITALFVLALVFDAISAATGTVVPAQ